MAATTENLPQLKSAVDGLTEMRSAFRFDCFVFSLNRRSDVFVIVVSVRMRGVDSSTSFHATSGLFSLFVVSGFDHRIGSGCRSVLLVDDDVTVD